jgi:hypothetical protein
VDDPAHAGWRIFEVMEENAASEKIGVGAIKATVFFKVGSGQIGKNTETLLEFNSQGASLLAIPLSLNRGSVPWDQAVGEQTRSGLTLPCLSPKTQ